MTTVKPLWHDYYMLEIGELERLTTSAAKYAGEFAAGVTSSPPNRQIVVLTCMDARVHPYALLGLDFGDAHVLRNAGGRVTTDMIRSAVVSANLLETRHILVIHHTDCGIANASQSEIESAIAEHTGHDASEINFETIGDRRESLESDVDRLLTCEMLPDGIDVSGWMVNVGTGELEQWVPPRQVNTN